MSTENRPKPISRWRLFLGTAWAILFAASLVALVLLLGDYDLFGYRHLSPLFILLNVPVITATFLLAKLLMRLHPVFAWKPSDLFFRKGAGGTEVTSLLIVAMTARWLGPVVTPLLLVNLPIIAMLEEFIFRQGTVSWADAIWRSALFGLAHLAMNIQLGASLAIGGVGLWFTYWYFRGGIELSGAVHFAYILPIVVLGVIGLILARFKRPDRT